MQNAKRSEILVQSSKDLPCERVFKLPPFAEHIKFHPLDNPIGRSAINQHHITLEADDQTRDAGKRGGKPFGNNLGSFSESALSLPGCTQIGRASCRERV